MLYVEEISGPKVIAKAPVSDVVWFEADSKYVTAHTLNQKLVINETLNMLEGLVGDSFVRSHRSALVRRDAIVRVVRDEDDTRKAVLTGDMKAPISRRHYRDVREATKC